jgi:hypothetical protein
MLTNITKIILQIENLIFFPEVRINEHVANTIRKFLSTFVRLGYSKLLSFHAWVTKNRRSRTVYALKDTFTQPFNLLQSESHI